MVDEVEQLIRDYDIDNIDFQDANFIGPGLYGKERAHAIADELIRRRLRVAFRILCSADTVESDLFHHLAEAGLYGVVIGIESGVQRFLDDVNKGIAVGENVKALRILDEIGILSKSIIGFIPFDTRTSIDELHRNLEFMREHVKYLNPTMLTNVLHSFEEATTSAFGRVAGPSAMKEGPLGSCPPEVLLAYAAFNMINAHFLTPYYAIISRGGEREAEELTAWSSNVLNLATKALSEIEEWRSGHVLEVASATCYLKELNEAAQKAAARFGTLEG